MCNNNRPKLTDEQKMVNAIFHSTFGEKVYVEEEDDKYNDEVVIIDPDTLGEYMLTVSRFIHFMADAIEENSEDRKEIDSWEYHMDLIDQGVQIMRRLLKAEATYKDIKVINEWEEAMESM
jgi:HD superfamily phosphohydrolase YqeK